MNALSISSPAFKFYFSIHKGKKSEVTAHTYVLTRPDLGAHLAHQNITSQNGLTTVAFYASVLRI